MTRKCIKIFCLILTLVLLAWGAAIGPVAKADDQPHGGMGSQTLTNQLGDDGVLMTSSVEVVLDEMDLAPPPSPEELEKIAVPDSIPLHNASNPQSPFYGKFPLPPNPTFPRFLQDQALVMGNSQISPQPMQQGDQNFGTRITNVSPEPSNVGAYAMLKVNPMMNMPTGKLLYAPNLMPPNNSALEAGIYYWHRDGSQTTDRFWFVFNHVNGGFPVREPIDGTFMTKYASGGFCQTIVMKYPEGWRVYLWNFQTNQWEQKYVLSGSSNNPAGWSIWEAKGWLDYIPTIQQIEAKSLQVYTTQGWKFVTATYGSEINVAMHPSWQKTWISRYDNWRVSP